MVSLTFINIYQNLTLVASLAKLRVRFLMATASLSSVSLTCSASARPLQYPSSNSRIRDMADPLVILIIINLNRWDRLPKLANKARKVVIRETMLSSILKRWELNKAKCSRVVQMMISRKTSFWWDHLLEPNNLVPNNENRVAFLRNDKDFLAVFLCWSFETTSLSL